MERQWWYDGDERPLNDTESSVKAKAAIISVNAYATMREANGHIYTRTKKRQLIEGEVRTRTSTPEEEAGHDKTGVVIVSDPRVTSARIEESSIEQLLCNVNMIQPPEKLYAATTTLQMLPTQFDVVRNPESAILEVTRPVSFDGNTLNCDAVKASDKLTHAPATPDRSKISKTRVLTPIELNLGHVFANDTEQRFKKGREQDGAADEWRLKWLAKRSVFRMWLQRMHTDATAVIKEATLMRLKETPRPRDDVTLCNRDPTTLLGYPILGYPHTNEASINAQQQNLRSDCTIELAATHSIRISGATALLSAGVAVETVQIAGRLDNRVFMGYTRHKSEIMGGIASSMIRTKFSVRSSWKSTANYFGVRPFRHEISGTAAVVPDKLRPRRKVCGKKSKLRVYV